MKDEGFGRQPRPHVLRPSIMRSLRFRIAAAYILLLAIAMTALGLVLLRSGQQRLRGALDERLVAEARLAAEAVRPLLLAHSGIDAVDPLVKRLGADGQARVTVIGPDGVVLGDSENDPHQLENHGSRPEVIAARQTGIGRATRHSATENRDFTYVAYAVRDDGRLVGYVRTSLPLSTVNADLRHIAVTVAATAAVATVAAAALAVLIAGAVTRPLSRLRAAALGLARGAFDHEAVPGGGTEVEDLAAAFNDMAGRLRTTITTLSEEHSRLEALLATSADALAVLDDRGVIRYLNPAAVRLFGSAAHQPFAEAARNHELTALLDGATRERRTASGIVHLPARDIWLQVTCSPITGGGGWSTLVILHDVTDTRRAEIARRDFVANVSHELRTPLAGIKAVVETLRDGAMDDPAAASEFLERVDGEVDRLVQMVEELLQLARAESGAAPVLSQIAPDELLAACVDRFRPMAERAGVDLALDALPDLPPVQADATMLGQAVGNLIHNAIKFTPPGGRVAVSARAAVDELRIAVSDTGAGIDPAELPRIFERFYVADRSRSRRGTGLGLAIVKHVARAHGGTVEAHSDLGQGSTFTVHLPLSAYAPAALPLTATDSA
jgi:two-component system phosphate regulon sensor histidine kinase PhoR